MSITTAAEPSDQPAPPDTTTISVTEHAEVTTIAESTVTDDATTSAEITDDATTTTGVHANLSTTVSVEEILERHKRSLERDNSNSLQTRSLCSWYYTINHDENRLPVDIQVASGECVNRVAGQTENACYAIKFWVPIRTKTVSSTGVVSWVDNWMQVPVGCTLANRVIYTPGPILYPTPGVDF